MPVQVRIAHMKSKIAVLGAVVVNACSNTAVDWQRDLSPFFLGPVWLYEKHWAKKMENAWQYSKLYAEHADDKGCATDKYWEWAQEGWDNDKAVRYPMGKGAKPLCSLWRGEKLDYILARKMIYGPLYRSSVQKMDGYVKLSVLYDELEKSKDQQTLVIRDWDGYDHVALNMSYTDVLNNPARKMGHAFVLGMLLTKDDALNQVRTDWKVAESSPPERWFEKKEEKKEE